MSRFINKALAKFTKLDRDQIRSLLLDIASENELLEGVLESLTDGLLVTDKNHKVLYCNKAAERLIPFYSQDVLEKVIWKAVDDREISEFIRETLMDQDRVEDVDFSLDWGGATRTLCWSIMPLVKNGGIQGNIFHVEDVTEKRAREARFRRAESLASLTTLAAGVAHEIKNPLGSIGIHIQLIQRALKKNGSVTEESAGHYLDVLNEEVERLNGIVVDFLFAVRPMDANLEERDLNEVLRDLIDFVHYELDEENIALVENLDSKLPRVMLDVKYMKQALLNIIKNALSAMHGGGTLTVTTKRLENAVFCEIRDTGVGISDENMASTFEPYFTTKEFGSGLGLTVVYKVIKEHRGEISLNSVEGKGTSFGFTIPLTQKEQRLIGWKDDEENEI